MDGAASKRRGSFTGRPRAPHSNVFRVPSNISVTLGLQWNFIGEEPIDLDASCVAFDKECNAVDVVFFNHLETANKYMVHSGDNRTGEDDGDDDEAVTFNMSKIPDNVYYMMVCVTSYNGSDFRLVETANVRIINNVDGKIVGTFALSVVGQHTATLLCVFSRHLQDITGDASEREIAAATQFWDLREINKPCFGFSFCDLLPEMMKLLGIEDMEDIRERVKSLPDYSLEKSNNVDEMPLSQLRLGLGWDGENDLDASVVMLGDNGAYIDHVHAKYGKLRSRDGAVKHSGDKLNGYAVAGDDEYIEVNLMIVDQKVTAIYFLAILYDGLAESLNDVPKCYIRMQNKASPNDRNFTEIARTDINAFPDTFTSLVAFAVVRQSATQWSQPLAIVNECQQGRDWVDVFPFLRTFHRVNLQINRPPADWPSAWQSWRSDLFPFAIRVTFGTVRDLSPQEPHFFRAHCLAWIQDRRGSPRFRSQLVADRENIHFGESFQFVVDKMDVLRVMVYETAAVAWVDIPMTDFFGKSGLFPEPLSDADVADGKAQPPPAKLDAFQAFSSARETGAAEDEDDVELMPRQETTAPRTGSAQRALNTTLETLPPEEHLLVDDWFPLSGQDVSGEIHLRLERVQMPEAPKQQSSACCVM